MRTKKQIGQERVTAQMTLPSSAPDQIMLVRTHQPGGDNPARVGLRLSPEAKQIVEQAAALLGMTVNAFATAQVVERSQQVLRETHGLILDNKARDRFLTMLDNPEGPNDALKAAAERYKKGKVSGDRYIFKI